MGAQKSTNQMCYIPPLRFLEEKSPFVLAAQRSTGVQREIEVNCGPFGTVIYYLPPVLDVYIL